MNEHKILYPNGNNSNEQENVKIYTPAELEKLARERKEALRLYRKRLKMNDKDGNSSINYEHIPICK